MYIEKVKCTTEYDIIIGKGILENPPIPGKYIAEKKIAIITDSNVAQFYLEKFKNGVARLKPSEIFSYVIEAGEESKNFKNLEQILEWLAENKFTRTDTLIALGGGVVGDLTGFVAGVYLRGVEFVQVPTTVLAAVDSSVGGKTAVNLTSGKNLAGVFKQPVCVICDTNVFETLSDEVFSDGMAEVIKYGVIKNQDLFEKIAALPHREITEEIVSDCVRIKADIVAEDEFDKGERQLLNFGHTIAHSLEKLSNFKISHGSAVAIGMAEITKRSENSGYVSEFFYSRLIEVLKAKGLPTTIDEKYCTKEIALAALNDKKMDGKNLTLVIPRKLGFCTLEKNIDFEELLNAEKKSD